MEENKQTQTEQETQQVRGWKDVAITPDMPLTAIVHFFNILNQRLCTLEDNLLVEMAEGQKLSISEIYRIQSEQELKAEEESKEETKGE